MKKHLIDLAGINNARDLGGYPVGDKTVKSGALLRTGSLDRAEPEAIRKLRDEYHVRTVVDFRMAEERQAMPDPEIPESRNLFLPVLNLREMIESNPEGLKHFGGSAEKALAESGRIIAQYADPRADRIALFNQMYENDLIDPDIYLGFLFSDRGKEAYKAFFKEVLSLEEGTAILWHCTDGKDRTGCASMLLLSALGASRETIMEDYLLTNEVNAEKLAFVRESAEAARLDKTRLDLLLFMSGGAIESFMKKAIDALTERYGSVHGYLAQELETGEAELKALSERFLI